MRLWREKKGVSVVLGTLLMFTLLFALYTSIQVTQVPIWNSQIDLQAYETTYGDMLFLKSDVKNVTLLKQPKSTIIRMGARYPNRMVFINPKQGIYGLMDREDATVTVQYTITWSTGQATYTENYTSSRLIYESMGAERIKIIYEHGLIIRQFPAGSASTDPQELIVDEELSVPLLDASLLSPRSSMRSESFSIKPYASSQTKQNVTLVTITLPTKYPQVWVDCLEGLETDRMSISVNQTANQVIITSRAIRRITFPANPATDSTLSAGVIAMSTRTASGFDPTTDFPSIRNITFAAVGQGNERKYNTTITATVKNVTAPFDIHADLTNLTKDMLEFDEQPTYSSPLSIDAPSWDVPNENTVKWEWVNHEEFTVGTVIAINFWVYNSVLDQQYFVTGVTYRKSTDGWQ